jgi:hypothetical protein
MDTKMFSQKSIDDMPILDLVRLIKSMANEVSIRIDDAEDALDYCHALSNLTQNLTQRIEDYIEE